MPLRLRTGQILKAFQDFIRRDAYFRGDSPFLRVALRIFMRPWGATYNFAHFVVIFYDAPQGRKQIRNATDKNGEFPLKYASHLIKFWNASKKCPVRIGAMAPKLPRNPQLRGARALRRIAVASNVAHALIIPARSHQIIINLINSETSRSKTHMLIIPEENVMWHYKNASS